MGRLLSKQSANEFTKEKYYLYQHAIHCHKKYMDVISQL